MSLFLAIPMASAITLQRQLAPTVGPTEASIGVMILTGPLSPSSARVAFGVVLRVGALDFVIDNASRFGARAPLPRGVILPFGSHRVFIASVSDMYSREVRVFSDTSDPLPPSCCSAAPDGSALRICAEVMMAGAASSHHNSGNTAAQAAREAATAAAAGPSGVRDVLNTLVDLSADLAVAHTELEKARQQLAEHAKSIGAEKGRLEATIREYNAAHGVGPRVIEPVVLEELHISG